MWVLVNLHKQIDFEKSHCQGLRNMTISIICQNCKAKLKTDLANAGKTAICPKCKFACKINSTAAHMITDEDSVSPEKIGAKSIVHPENEQAFFNSSQIQFNCEGCSCWCDSKRFVMLSPNQETRLLLKNLVAISFTNLPGVKKPFVFTVIQQIFIQIVLFPIFGIITIACLANLFPNANVTPVVSLLLLAIDIFVIFLILCWLIHLNRIPGFYMAGPLSVAIVFQNKTEVFKFITNKEEAMRFFHSVEDMALGSNSLSENHTGAFPPNHQTTPQ